MRIERRDNQNEEENVCIDGFSFLTKIDSFTIICRTELADSEQDIAKLHSEFMATASIAQSYDGSSLVKGCHNRKSLSYYMDESVKALYQLKTNINLINRISKENGFHDDETYEQLQSIVSAMGKAHENIEEFVLYSKPLTNSSQRKCQK